MLKLDLKTFLIIGLVLFVISSCSLFPNSKPRSQWLTKWLSNPTCQPPCWETIVPGKTKIYDAVTLLETMNGIYTVKHPIKGPFGESLQFTWRFDLSNDSGIGSTDEQGSVLDMVSINIYEPVTLSEVTTKYGLPTNVLLYDCRSETGRKTCVVHLIYKNKGLALELFLIDSGNNNYKVKILPNSSINRIWFFPDYEDAYINKIGKNSFNYPKYFFNWNGYIDYP